MYDIVIIGAGPAGMTAAIYALRAGKSVAVIEKATFGGQITHSPRVENYPGFIRMSGNEFAEKLIDQVTELGGELEMDEITSINEHDGIYTVQGEDGNYDGKAVIIATGSTHRELDADKEYADAPIDISYCTVCDGAFYKGKTVAVIGGGNTALQSAVMLADGCKKVYIIQNLDFITGEKALEDKLNKADNVEMVFSSVVKKLLGKDCLTGIVIEDTKGKQSTIELDGLFVAIGQIPQNKPFEKIVKLNGYGYIDAGEDCIPESSMKGVFVAGDCRSKSVRQVTTATADGAVAALAACRYIDR